MTLAQASKARRYVERGLVRTVARSDSAAGWGVPWGVDTTYVVEALPGCKGSQEVRVAERYAGDGAFVDATWTCTCQHANGRPGAADLCSHAMAVHLARRPA